MKKELVGHTFISKTGDEFTIVEELPKKSQRRFMLQCNKCGTQKDTNYCSIYQTNNIRCVGCLPPAKQAILKREGTRVKEYVGKTIKMKFDEFYIVSELPRTLSKQNNVYRNFLVRCTNCQTERATLAASINSGGVACKNCMVKERNIRFDTSLPPIDFARKAEIAQEMNNIWDEMLYLHKNDALIRYLVTKYEVNERLLEDKQPEQPPEPIEEDDIDYEIDIDWDQEINRLIDGD